MSRLPVPGSDTGTWGYILNDFLDVAHNSDGTLKSSAVADSGAEQVVNKGAASGYTPLNASSKVSIAYLPTGTTSTTVAIGNDSRITGAVQASTATTKGDLLAATAASTITRLGVGGDGQVLTADSSQATGIKWAATGASTISVSAKSSSYTLTNSDDVIKATASGIVLTLHDATTATVKRYTLQNASNGNISFATTSSQTVNGSTTGTIIPNQSLDVVPDGANWIII